MLSIQGFLNCHSKLTMNYKHLSQVERYQFYALMKAGHDLSQFAKLLALHKSTISRELSRKRGPKCFRPRQACATAAKRSEKTRNAATMLPWVAEQTACLLKVQWSPEHIAGKLPVSHVTLYQHVYSYKARGGTLSKNLSCQKQKRKRYAGGRDRQGQILHRRPLCDRPSHIESRKQVSHWECDKVIAANDKGAILTMVKRKSCFGAIIKVAHKTSDFVSRAIVEGLQPFASRVKTLTYDNGKEFVAHIQIDQGLNSTGYSVRHFASWERGSNENFTVLLRQYVPKKRLMNTVDE
jgi:IS30 family transposase